MVDLANSNIGAGAERLFRIALAVLALCVFAISMRLLQGEFAAHKAQVAGAQGAYGITPNDMAQPVNSVQGVYGRLETCIAAMTDLVTLLQPSEARQKVAQNCVTFANGVLEKSPALSMAQLVTAIGSMEIGDVQASRQSLLLSEAAAGNSIPNAQRRAALWIGQFASLSNQEVAALSRDLSRIGDDSQGVQWLAGAYVSNPSLRPILQQVMQAKPSNAQAEFFNVIRNMVK